MVLKEVTSLAEDAFYDSVRQRVTNSPAKDAFIFVHGYNVDFKTAARRVGQFAFDLGFIRSPNPLLAFQRHPRGLQRFANVGWRQRLDASLRILEARSGARKIHLIAHSMGNRAVVDALKALSYHAGVPSLIHCCIILLWQLPDIDAKTFRQLASALRQVSDHITLYASSKDKAIAASAKPAQISESGRRPRNSCGPEC